MATDLALWALLEAAKDQVARSVPAPDGPDGLDRVVPAEERIAQALQLFDTVESLQPLEPTPLPVVEEWLEPAAQLAAPATDELPSTTDLATALVAAKDCLRWSRAYPDAPKRPDVDEFLDNYAYGLLVAAREPDTDNQPYAPFTSEQMMLGFTIQAPNLLYPRHSHIAVELYGVIAGNANWYHPAMDWPLRPPGSVMVHEEFQHHAMRTHDEPLLCWVMWVTEPNSPAELHLDI